MQDQADVPKPNLPASQDPGLWSHLLPVVGPSKGESIFLLVVNLWSRHTIPRKWIRANVSNSMNGIADEGEKSLEKTFFLLILVSLGIQGFLTASCALLEFVTFSFYPQRS